MCLLGTFCGYKPLKIFFGGGILLVKSPFKTGSRSHILVVSFDGIQMKVDIPAKIWITKLPHYIWDVYASKGLTAPFG